MAIFPSPGPARPGVQIFLAPRLWEFNVCGAVVAAVVGGVLLLVIAGILIWQTRRLEWLALLLVLNVVIGAPLMFRPGNLVAMFPYAAELEEGKGVRFYTPFNGIYVRIEEIKQVRWSYARTGWVVKLKRRHGLVGRLVIHAAWGAQGRDLAGAIEHELAPIGG